MNVHDKLLRDIERALDSRSYQPKEMAARFSEMGVREQALWIGTIAETLYYIQANADQPYCGYSPEVAQLVDALLCNRYMGHLYGQGTWSG